MQRQKNLNMNHIKGMILSEVMQVLQDAGMDWSYTNNL